MISSLTLYIAAYTWLVSFNSNTPVGNRRVRKAGVGFDCVESFGQLDISGPKEILLGTPSNTLILNRAVTP